MKHASPGFSVRNILKKCEELGEFHRFVQELENEAMEFLKKFSVLNIRKMRSHYKNKDLLKNQPFYNSEIKSNKKEEKN